MNLTLQTLSGAGGNDTISGIDGGTEVDSCTKDPGDVQSHCP